MVLSSFDKDIMQRWRQSRKKDQLGHPAAELPIPAEILDHILRQLDIRSLQNVRASSQILRARAGQFLYRTVELYGSSSMIRSFAHRRPNIWCTESAFLALLSMFPDIGAHVVSLHIVSSGDLLYRHSSATELAAILPFLTSLERLVIARCGEQLDGPPPVLGRTTSIQTTSLIPARLKNADARSIPRTLKYLEMGYVILEDETTFATVLASCPEVRHLVLYNIRIATPSRLQRLAVGPLADILHLRQGPTDAKPLFLHSIAIGNRVLIPGLPWLMEGGQDQALIDLSQVREATLLEYTKWRDGTAYSPDLDRWYQHIKLSGIRFFTMVIDYKTSAPFNLTELLHLEDLTLAFKSPYRPDDFLPIAEPITMISLPTTLKRLTIIVHSDHTQDLCQLDQHLKQLELSRAHDDALCSLEHVRIILVVDEQEESPAQLRQIVEEQMPWCAAGKDMMSVHFLQRHNRLHSYAGRVHTFITKPYSERKRYLAEINC
ncbi:hypothetical protein CYLTODRAFT_36528 [Cylindrobasidium torrendii FP15055 ss-10]|uniref:F-box domain-containing protein n=1 Tax=Cylindrobasidium torrendii FP15055 ss-10 TaxID=1314674 RepID=A0A0D7BPF9_9AGAR|nr:hypothetical protein CYLTODRAFT_36528 [Cylindrobasidium torrendii FP15055 ss-10]